MRIEIAQRLRPFSHVPGATCVLPKSVWQVQVFPTKLLFNNLQNGKQLEFPIALKGPMHGFTVELDLEKAHVRVFGKTPDGFVRYVIRRDEEGIVIHVDKKSPQLLALAKDEDAYVPVPLERLSLGIHKAQDAELICKRHDLKEIFPLWHRLGRLIPSVPSKKVGTLALLEQCRKQALAGDKEDLAASFLNLFDAGFSSLLTPRLRDEQFQGLIPDLSEIPAGSSSLPLLSEGAALIRSLFLQESPNELALLPCLLPEFHSGRLTSPEISLEWSKKLLRCVILRPSTSREVRLILQKPLDSFRLRTSLRERGRVLTRDEPLQLTAGKTLFLDRFQK
jgi:hypothetical protein